MTAALVILAGTALVLVAVVFYVVRMAGRAIANVEAAAGGTDHRGLAQRLVDELEQARQREARAIAIAEERRAEAAGLRADLDRRAHAELVGERVVVRTVDGHTIEGDLERLYSDGMLLSRAHYLGGEGPTELGGYITIREANESFIQRPAAEEPSAEELA